MIHMRKFMRKEIGDIYIYIYIYIYMRSTEAAVKFTIKLNSDSETTASTQKPPEIIIQYRQSCIT